MGISQRDMDEAEHWLCLPLVMIVNFSLFQYLVVMYFRRRSEARVILLLGCAFVGFAVIIPQAYPNDEIVGHLNDISEGCSTLTFLTQITIIGRDIERKVRIRSLKCLTYAAELLIFISLLDIVLNVVDVTDQRLDLSSLDGVDNIIEITSLFFVFFFRFFYLTMSRGFKWLLANKKLEMFLYVLFMTHEFPFMLLASWTGVTWEPVQAIWHRLTLMMCVLMTIKEKLSARRTKASKENKTTVGVFSKAPSIPQLQDKDDDNESEERGSSKKRKLSLISKPRLFLGKVLPKPSTRTTAKTSGTSSLVRSGLFSNRGPSLNQSVRSSHGVKMALNVIPGGGKR